MWQLVFASPHRLIHQQEAQEEQNAKKGALWSGQIFRIMAMAKKVFFQFNLVINFLFVCDFLEKNKKKSQNHQKRTTKFLFLTKTTNILYFSSKKSKKKNWSYFFWTYHMDSALWAGRGCLIYLFYLKFFLGGMLGDNYKW